MSCGWWGGSGAGGPGGHGYRCERRRLGHQRDQVERHRGSRYAGDLGVVVGGCDLDHVATDDVEAVEPAEQVEQLTTVEPAHLGGARARRERRVEDVDVDRDVDRGVPDALSDQVDGTVDAEDVEVTGPDDPEAEVVVVDEVELVVDRAADAEVDRLVLRQQAFFGRPAEDGAVGERRVEVGVPRVQVRVEVDQRDGTVLVRAARSIGSATVWSPPRVTMRRSP